MINRARAQRKSRQRLGAPPRSSYSHFPEILPLFAGANKRFACPIPPLRALRGKRERPCSNPHEMDLDHRPLAEALVGGPAQRAPNRLAHSVVVTPRPGRQLLDRALDSIA